MLPLSNMQHEHTANPGTGCYILAATRLYALLQNTHHQYAKHHRGLCQGHTWLRAYACMLYLRAFDNRRVWCGVKAPSFYSSTRVLQASSSVRHVGVMQFTTSSPI